MFSLTSKAKRVIVWDLEEAKMADNNKERIAIIGEVVVLRDPSDEANNAQTVGLIKDFSDSRPKLIDVELANQDIGQTKVSEVKKAQTLDVINIDGLSLPTFANRTHLRRVLAKKDKLAKAA